MAAMSKEAVCGFVFTSPLNTRFQPGDRNRPSDLPNRFNGFALPPQSMQMAKLYRRGLDARRRFGRIHDCNLSHKLVAAPVHGPDVFLVFVAQGSTQF